MYEMSPDKSLFNLKLARKVARRTVLLGKYYDNITPAAIGGQPFQIYYMRKNSRLPSGVSTSIPIFGMISGQIGFIIIAVFCFLLGSLSINNAVLIGTACFGLLFYAFWPVTVMIATFLPKATTEIIGLFVKFLAKIHIVKDVKKTREKTEYEVTEYAKCVRKILKTKGLFLKTVFCFNRFWWGSGLSTMFCYDCCSHFSGVFRPDARERRSGGRSLFLSFLSSFFGLCVLGDVNWALLLILYLYNYGANHLFPNAFRKKTK